MVLLVLGAGAVWLAKTFAADAPAEPSVPITREAMKAPVERLHAEQRRVAAVDGSVPSDVDAGRPVTADPLLRLVPPQVKDLALVIELNSVVNSELGDLFADCLVKPEDALMNSLRDAGIDLTTTIDRVAFVDDSIVLSGDFRSGGWKRLLPSGAIGKGYGARAELFELPAVDGGYGSIGSWNGQLVIFGPSEAGTRALLDRVEGTSTGAGLLDPARAFGDFFGEITPEAIAVVFDGKNPLLANQLRDDLRGLRLHVDFSGDVGLMAELHARDGHSLGELRRSLHALLAAVKERPGHAENLFDFVTIGEPSPDGAMFVVEAGLPKAYVKNALKKCVDARASARSADGGSR